jgi:hypothetical protein
MDRVGRREGEREWEGERVGGREEKRGGRERRREMEEDGGRKLSICSYILTLSLSLSL